MDEWGAAAFNVLRREGRSLSLSKLCPKSWRPALRPRPLGPASQSCQGHRAPPTQAGPLTPVPPLWTPPLLAPPPACAPLLTTASMSAPRSSNSSTASWHSVFTATCRAVSPEGEGGSVQPGPGALLPQKDARSGQTAPPCTMVGAHLRNCEPPGPRCRGPRCPAGPAGRSGCGAHTLGGLLSGHCGPVPWGWHQPSPRAALLTAKS